MSKSVLSNARFHDEAAALAYIEGRLWPHGPTCPHCGNADQAKIGALKGKSTRPGVRKCYECRKPFTVKVGTIFESSHVPLHLWLQAIHLLCASKKGMSSNQLHRVLGITLKSAWFLSHRIREAMTAGNLTPLGGEGKVVEVDETYYGDLPEEKRAISKRNGRPMDKFAARGGYAHKRAILSLVERGGEARSFYVENAPREKVVAIVRANIAKESRLHTDESHLYKQVGKEFANHETVVHSKEEYARGDVTTNTVEGFYSIFKRGMRGVYQFCGEKHLHRYLAEFDFRYSARVALGVDDAMRADKALKGVVGKRLTYKAAGR
jgi:transposase-like protein